MATFDNAAIVREFYRAFEEKDLERIRTLMMPDATMSEVPFGATRNLAEHCEIWGRAFPDAKVELLNVVSQGDLVVAEFIGRATHAGPLPGPGGMTLSPSNKRLEVRFVEVFQFRGGRIALARQYFDALGVMNQLGLGAQVMQAQQPTASMPEARH